MTGCFLLPLFALTVLRYVEGELDERGVWWRLALLLAYAAHLFKIVVTLAATATLALLFGASRVRVRAAVVNRGSERLARGAAAYATAAVIDGPFVFYLLNGFRSGTFAGNASALTDLTNVLLPTETNGLAGRSFTSVSRYFDGTESGLTSACRSSSSSASMRGAGGALPAPAFCCRHSQSRSFFPSALHSISTGTKSCRCPGLLRATCLCSTTFEPIASPYSSN